MNLLIDDKRDMPNGVIARGFEEGKTLLKLDIWETLYIDHDLGEIKTGYDLITWALEDVYTELPYKIVVVSSNPVGVENIARALIRYGYRRLGNEFRIRT